MTIAGSDSGAGAGIQADLKTFAALGVYGTSAVTVVTAQNTLGVRAVRVLDADLVGGQIDAIATDIGADAVKTGVLGSAEIIEVVAARLGAYGLDNLVVDPVMVATSGQRLLASAAVRTLTRLLLPLAQVVTPNLAEAGLLTGKATATAEGRREAARALGALGPRYVLLKGGHLEGPAVDLLFDGHDFIELVEARVETPHTHGTGCTLSAAIVAHLARGCQVPEAVALAKRYVTEALRAAYPIGGGRGPVHHFYALWSKG